MSVKEGSRDIVNDDRTYATHSSVYKTFLESGPQNEAYDIIVTELLKGEFRWTLTKEDGTIRAEIQLATSKEFQIWAAFVQKIVLQIMVFGFAVYRPVRTGTQSDIQFRGESTSKYQDEKIRLVVANSQMLVLEYDRKKARWDVFENGGTDSILRNGGGWNLLVFNEPRLVGDKDTPVIASAAAKSYFTSIYLSRLHKNVQRRDALNTDPVVYTTASKVMMGAASRPLVNGPQDMQQTNIMGEERQDYSSYLAERLDTFRTLDQLSKEARASAKKAMLEVSGREEDELDKSLRPVEMARELFITDGRDATEMGYRKGPESFEMIEKSLRQSIMKAWQIPLQVTGENINSERLASSDRLSQMAISRFDAFIKTIRCAIQVALDKVSRVVTKTEHVSLRLWPCVSAYNLSQIEMMLTEREAVHLTACVYDIPEHYLDHSKIRRRQQVMLEGTQPDGATASSAGHVASKHDAGGSGTGVRNKPPMSQKSKEVRKDKKAAT